MSLTSHRIPASPVFFDKIVWDFLNQQLPSSLSNFLPTKEHIQKIITSFQQINFNRPQLLKILNGQAQSVSNTTPETFQNIQKLADNYTFTITTGHQLCLFTGPLYVIYKISATIQLSQWLQNQFPEYNFVPVFWMASEDHDINEINHFYYNDHLFQWNQSTNGSPVFSITTEGLEDVFNSMKISQLFSPEDLELFQQAYLQHSNYIDATRFLLNELFGKYGLIILNPNEKAFKEKFKDIFYQEIFEKKTYHSILSTLDLFDKHNFHIQVNPRTINTFLNYNNKRSLIIENNETFKLKDLDITFSKNELEKLLVTQPELFSPNVLLRPLFQQTILPNLAYIGGSAEIAYWLELTSTFDSFSVHYPLLIQRPIIFISPPRISSKIEKLQIQLSDIFHYNKSTLIKNILDKLNLSINFKAEKQQVNSIYDNLLKQTENIDKSLIPFVNAEHTKALKAIDTLEQKLNKSIKQKNNIIVNHIEDIYSNFFPDGIMQDRKWNVAYASNTLNINTIKNFIDNIIPFSTPQINSDFNFTIIEKSEL
ncbi:MAG: putative cysteine ligase BshC [Bacteroidia bacterium]|nr:MAG: putative cysteine ligase BshC [Bacteroidia bacterium]